MLQSEAKLSTFNVICHLMAKLHTGSSVMPTKTKCAFKPRITPFCYN